MSVMTNMMTKKNNDIILKIGKFFVILRIFYWNLADCISFSRKIFIQFRKNFKFRIIIEIIFFCIMFEVTNEKMDEE